MFNKYQLILIFILLIPVSVGISYQIGDITYIFDEETLSIEPNGGGILINDVHEMKFFIEGGSLNISFYDIDKIGLLASVPQTLTFDIKLNNTKQILVKNDSYYIDSYDIGTKEDIFTMKSVKSGDSIIKESESEIIKNLSWYEKKIFEYEYKSEKDSSGIISGKNFTVSYLNFTIFCILILGGLIIWLVKQ